MCSFNETKFSLIVNFPTTFLVIFLHLQTIDLKRKTFGFHNKPEIHLTKTADSSIYAV